MKLEELLKGINVIEIKGDSTQTVSDIHIDSRKVEAGHLFIAVKGTQTDGHAYIGKAIELGASAIVCETFPEDMASHVTYIKVADTEDCVGKLATVFYGDPTSKLELIGVTGTNGKTTIATLLYNMFRKFGYKVGLISTVCNYIDDEAIPTEHTTPDPITLNKLLGRMADEGCKYAFMEVSSHSVAQKRIGGLKFAGGIFTNLTRDHLDYHQTVDNYLKAKKAFFDNLPKSAFALTNLDDKIGMVMVQNTKAKVCTYSLRSISDFKGKVLEDGFEGMLLDINNVEVNVQFIGRFNASNLLAVYGTACLLGKKPEDVLLVLSTLQPVSGRFDALRSPRGYSAIVDYAHTPDALTNVLNTIQEVLNGRGNIITVVGAGGNRDKGKRPIMAQEAAKYSDKVIITSDNPRFEEPQDIINDMLAGLSKEDMRKVISIVDRKEAIKTACMLAQAGDAILVAGKGHENYQDIKGVKHHFDDKEVIREIFENE
ncbi:MAG: UDP-N-acetylmuramoyl-L-alanyl-D-glutamate--2,6-diaminopimelate ligase [Bacteroides sp.]|nr:UDP-N-acetylmuramoyl-L-alanyl-D-glutamate--2,6-diaminopimelate ligase [Bacteroides sp.]MBQ8874038.1 UDP-N-acetylmuramoyl-L-alanyl-D-glutamate--2,6-diaminopimelate ligase [Bacteroides sp.]